MWEQRTNDAMAKARGWLRELPLNGEGPVFHLLRLFALTVIDGEAGPDLDHDAALPRLGEAIPDFDPRGVSLDPVLVLVTYRALRARGFEHPSLKSLVHSYGSALSSDSADVDDELALVARLCRLCGVDAPDPGATAARALQSPAGLMAGDRAETLETCRLMLMISACGTRRMDLGDVPSLLPGLSLSYAMEWDMEAATTLLRACAYAGVANEACSQWAWEWVLDQQREDGRFGLLAPETVKMGRDPADWRAYLGPTVSAAWCLAEMKRPGLLVAPD